MRRRDWVRPLGLATLAGGPALLLGAQAGWSRYSATTIMLIGDSTVASRPDANCLMMGWGRKLAEIAHPAARVVNRARSGSSSGGFLARDWPAVRAALKPDSLLLMQFGHVDSRRGQQDAYRRSLQRLLDEALQAGARPWLCTPVASWQFAGKRWVYEFAPFADRMQALAANRGLPLVDLGRLMGAKLDQLGPQPSRALFMLSHDGHDRVHLTASGAALAAGLVWQELQAAKAIA